MRIVLFGASGGSGIALTEAALARGHFVRAFCRRAVPVPPSGVELVVAALDDRAAVEAAVAGVDAVVCVLGPRPPLRDVFCAAATERICVAMTRAGCRRLVCQTGAMIGRLLPNVSRPLRLLARRFAAARPAVACDRAEQEAVVEGSGLDWTLLKPPRLRDGPRAEALVLATDEPVGLLSSVSRPALAAATLDLLEAGRFLRRAVYVRRAPWRPRRPANR